MRIIFLIIITAFFTNSALALPICEGSPSSGDNINIIKHWDNCRGTHIFDGGTYKGDMYSGEWKNGIPHGFGTVYYNAKVSAPEEKSSYTGKWANGFQNGFGTFRYANSGDIYIGENKNGKRGGFGTYLFGNGQEVWEGQWNNGDFISGKKYNSAGGETYYGEHNIYDIGTYRAPDDSFVIYEIENNLDSLSMDEAKNNCKDIGYKEGTERFGQCVLDLTK